MQILTLSLANFRCYDEKCVELGQGLHQITGPNGTGKTSILEAIYLAITGRSFRTDRLTELIKCKADSARIEVTFLKQGISQHISIHYGPQHRHIQLNGTRSSSWSGLLGALCGVAMTPGDVQLLHAGPRQRRRYLDLQLAQTEPLYVYHLKRFHQALKQRNRLLKVHSTAQIEIWEQLLAVSGEYIVRRRNELVEELVPVVGKIFEQFGDGRTADTSVSHERLARK